MAGKNRNKRGPPLCGDRLTDLFFMLIIETIRYRIVSIKKKKNVTNPDEKDPKKRRKTFYGLYDPKANEIFLSTSKCKHPTAMSMVSTLIHEIFHEIMPKVFHKRIYQIEKILKVRFTDEQKRYLKRFIPKHEAKTNPVPSE